MEENHEELRVRIPRRGEVLGIVESMLGANKLRVRCQDEKIRICRIPGRMRKRLWIRENDIVLVQPWQIQGEKSGDILWKYKPTEVIWLKKRNMINFA